MYDERTDSFVDGQLPNSLDSLFNSEKSKEFFEIKKASTSHEANDHGHH
jgi:hypothetical protein